MGKKASVRPAQQVLNANLVNRFGAAASSNALDKINFSTIKCHVCSRTRSVSFYSNRQILKHQNTVYNPYIPGGRSFKDYATCKDCTAAQVDIIHCFVCDLDKSIDSFFFNQRSQAKPRCKACVQFCLDTERHGITPNIDNYVDREDSSDESAVDGDDGDEEPVDVDEESDADVDTVPEVKKVSPDTATADVSKQMDLIDLSSEPERKITPITKTRGTTPASRATTAPADNSDNDVNDSDGGGWETVKVAGKTNSAYRTPNTYASIAVSGKTTPAGTSTASYTTTTRTTTTARTSGLVSPAKSASTVSFTSTGRQKWGKPVKLKASDVVENVWVSDVAKRNEWKVHGGQPKLVKTKIRAHNNESDEDEVDDGEE